MLRPSRTIIIAIVEADGREALYDEVSWDYVNPSCEWFRELKAFASGVVRHEPKYLVSKAAWFHCMPVNERPAEEKHARVSQDKGKRHIGEVRVSLANRFGFLERLLALDIVSIQSLIECFDVCRDLTKATYKFQLEGHEALSGMLSEQTQRYVFRNALKQVFCSTEGASLASVAEGYDETSQ